MPGSQAAPESTITQMTAILERHLRAPRKKCPPRLRKAFTAAHSSLARDQTEQIFLDTSPQAWLAYFLATHGHGRHYKGQKEDRNTIAAFDLLAKGERIRVAKSVASTVADSSVAALIRRLPMPPSRSAQDATVELSLSTGQRGSTNPPPEEQHEIAALSATSLEHTNQIPTSSIQGLNDMSNPLQQTISNPIVERIAAVFPDYMCGAIRTDRGEAGITMAFPYDITSPVACLMSLAILTNKVAFLAMRLFGIHVETEGGFRYIVLEHGARCIPGPEMSLQGARTDAVDTLLGPHISSAIAASPARREEVKQAILATRCVTMQITRNPDEGAILNLNLSLEGGYETRDKLFW